MFTRHQIRKYALSLLFSTGVVLSGFAQAKIKHIVQKDKHPITIGFQTGRELLFNSSPLLHSKQSKVHYGVSRSLVLRKPLNQHFKIETGLNYRSIQNTSNTFIYSEKVNNNPYSFALPVTVQYYFLPGKCKFHPYCGAGFRYNFFDSKNNPAAPIGVDVTPQNYIPQADTKYITILFTQGVTYEVNTKIEITQSFHFIPENTSNVIGIDLGIGFKLP